MGFAEEVAQAKSEKTFTLGERADTKAEYAQRTDHKAVNDPAPGQHELDGVAPTGEAPVAAEATPAEEVVSAPPQAGSKIRIGTQEFNSVEEAIQYAQDLEMTSVQQEAYLRGQNDAKPKEAVKLPPSIEEEIENQRV